MTNPLAAGSLSGKNVLVTGSSRGIGADTIRYFAGAGANVVINYRNKEARAVKLADEVRALGVQALVVGADLTDPTSVAAMFATTKAELGDLEAVGHVVGDQRGVEHGVLLGQGEAGLGATGQRLGRVDHLGLAAGEEHASSLPESASPTPLSATS